MKKEIQELLEKWKLCFLKAGVFQEVERRAEGKKIGVRFRARPNVFLLLHNDQTGSGAHQVEESFQGS
jgi:hypothetical protein